MATNSNVYVSEINFLIFFKIGRNFGFFQKTSSVHVNLSRLKRVPDGQKLIWCYLGVNVAKKQQCCFCCYFSNIFSIKTAFGRIFFWKSSEISEEAEISTEISAGGAQQHMLLKHEILDICSYDDIWRWMSDPDDVFFSNFFFGIFF